MILSAKLAQIPESIVAQLVGDFPKLPKTVNPSSRFQSAHKNSQDLQSAFTLPKTLPKNCTKFQYFGL